MANGEFDLLRKQRRNVTFQEPSKAQLLTCDHANKQKQNSFVFGPICAEK